MKKLLLSLAIGMSGIVTSVEAQGLPMRLKHLFCIENQDQKSRVTNACVYSGVDYPDTYILFVQYRNNLISYSGSLSCKDSGEEFQCSATGPDLQATFFYKYDLSSKMLDLVGDIKTSADPDFQNFEYSGQFSY